jgi:hypothetical protein
LDMVSTSLAEDYTMHVKDAVGRTDTIDPTGHSFTS